MSTDARPDDPPYNNLPETFHATYSASCFCGTTRWEIDGDALSSMYCHCETCQTLHGAPYQWAAVLHKKNVRIQTPESVAFYHATSRASIYKLPCKLSCRACRAPIADEGRNMMLMFPSFIDFPRNAEGRKVAPDAWKAQFHMFYGKRVADMHDGLDKYVAKKGEGKCSDQGRPIDEDNDKEKV